MTTNNTVQKDEDYEKKKFRTFTITRNYEYDVSVMDEDANYYIPEDAMTEEEWDKMVDDEWQEIVETKNVYVAAWLTHNKDFLKDGNKKGRHKHKVIEFHNARSLASVRKLYKVSRPENCTPVKSKMASFKYLLHITPSAIADNKHIYDQDNLTIHIDSEQFDNTFQSLLSIAGGAKSKDKESDEELMRTDFYMAQDEIMNGKLFHQNVYELLYNKWVESPECRDDQDLSLRRTELFWKMWNEFTSKFDKTGKEFRRLVAKNMKNGADRDLMVAYITGIGGSGKSRLATWLALYCSKNKSIHQSAPRGKGKTGDFTSLYDGEDATVIDEVDGSDFTPQEFNSTFDNHKYSATSSRNENEAWTSSFCAMTSYQSIQMFRRKMIAFSPGGSLHTTDEISEGNIPTLRTDYSTKDLCYQVQRRLTYHIEIKNCPRFKDKKMIRVQKFCTTRRGYLLLGEILVDSEFYYSDEKTAEVGQRVADLMTAEPLLDGRVEADMMIDNQVETYSLNDLLNAPTEYRQAIRELDAEVEKKRLEKEKENKENWHASFRVADINQAHQMAIAEEQGRFFGL